MEAATSLLGDFSSDVDVDPVDVDATRDEVADVLVQREAAPTVAEGDDVSATASTMLGSFIGQLGTQAASIHSVGSTVPDNLNATIQEAQATVQTAVAENQAVITDTVSAIQTKLL